MNKDLINELSNLYLKEKYLKRYLDKSYNSAKRKQIFEDLQKVKNDINCTKFKLKLERELNKHESNKRIK